MGQSLAAVSLLVRDYDEAITYFTRHLGFALAEDTPLGDGKRWVRVAPPGGTGATVLLARAATPEQASRVGDQAGGRVFLFLDTSDFWGDYAAFRARGVQFTDGPREEPYRTVAVFLDLYGNRWDLVQQRRTEPAATADRPGT